MPPRSPVNSSSTTTTRGPNQQLGPTARAELMVLAVRNTCEMFETLRELPPEAVTARNVRPLLARWLRLLETGEMVGDLPRPRPNPVPIPNDPSQSIFVSPATHAERVARAVTRLHEIYSQNPQRAPAIVRGLVSLVHDAVQLIAENQHRIARQTGQLANTVRQNVALSLQAGRAALSAAADLGITVGVAGLGAALLVFLVLLAFARATR